MTNHVQSRTAESKGFCYTSLNKFLQLLAFLGDQEAAQLVGAEQSKHGKN